MQLPHDVHSQSATSPACDLTCVLQAMAMQDAYAEEDDRDDDVDSAQEAQSSRQTQLLGAPSAPPHVLTRLRNRIVASGAPALASCVRCLLPSCSCPPDPHFVQDML